MNKYDVIVIGAGHAGCEAALASARLGAHTLVITINMDHIAMMSCNPAVGGIAKGQVVREIDAMGGFQGIATDLASIQFRILNQTKGAAVWSPRSQCDKSSYQRAMKTALELQDNLDILQAEVTDFEVVDGKLTGIVTHLGEKFYAKSIVLTTGTFMSGLLHYGMQNYPGGRAGDKEASKISDALKSRLNLRIGRLKTGTPPRILAKTIDFSQMSIQEANNCDEEFSFWENTLPLPAVKKHDMPCFMVYSTEQTAQIIRDNLHLSPMYQGKIKGIGTRYCPSFEDKIVRFPQHPRHLLYLEPEGEYTTEYYINGISTSLPIEVQKQLIASIPGMENAVISRYAYAIEYDFIYPDQLNRTLNAKNCENFFSAGQVNGTSGYEEAAGQGLVAGMNAAKYALNLPMVEMPRENSYIGVMIDDLVTKDIVEPYRLFTSRAEFRLHLRQDNADLRLCELAYANGLLPQNKYDCFCAYKNRLEELIGRCKDEKIANHTLWQQIKIDLSKSKESEQMLMPPENLGIDLNNRIDRRAWRELLVQAHYEGYLQREENSINKLKKLESWRIPNDFNYDSISGLRAESLLKLKRILPTSLAQAQRIDGVTPSELALLQVHLSRYWQLKQQSQ